MTPGAVLSPGDAFSIPNRSAHKLCLHCNGRLPMFRALFHMDFCTTEHEREVRKIIDDLGLKRLREPAGRLRLASGRVPVEASLDPETVR